MIRKDYLVRQFEEFGRVIARILGFRKDKESDRLQAEISNAVRRFTELEIDEVEKLDGDGFFKVINALDDDRLKMLADLLFEKMHFYIMREDDENFLLLKQRSRKAYELLRSRVQNNFNMDVYYRLQYLDAI